MALIELNYKKANNINYSLVTCDSDYHIGNRNREILKDNAKRGIGLTCCRNCSLRNANQRKKNENSYHLLAKEKGIKFVGVKPDFCNDDTVWECNCGLEFRKSYIKIKQDMIYCEECVKKHISQKSFKGYKEIGNTYWGALQRGAKERDLEFNIDIKSAYDLFVSQNRKCKISGVDLKFGKSGDQTASLDRIDSSKSYIEGNIQWVHKDINFMKGDLDEKYFINFCKQVAFSNKKVWIITGALGYIGFQICQLLQNHSDRIIAIDNSFDGFKVSKLCEWGIEFHHKDLFDIQALLKKADYCIHCAGITDVPSVASQSTPEKDSLILRTGVDGTQEIIKYTSQDCKIIFLSTHVIFEGLETVRFNIDELLPGSPILAYAKSKYSSENDLIKSGKNFIICRLGSVYGLPATRWKIVVNLFAKFAAIDGKIKIFGGECYKPVVGINDVARAILFLSENRFNQEIFNIVHENVKVKDIAQICKKYLNQVQIEEVKNETPNEGYTLSNKKIIDTGFIFEQNLNTEIGKMIYAWKNKSN